MTTAPPTHPEPAAPTFCPSQQTVDAVAVALFCQLADNVGEWEDQHPARKGAWRTMALGALNAAGQQVVTDALTHVIANHSAFGFSKDLANELDFARSVSAFEYAVAEVAHDMLEETETSQQDGQPTLG